MSVLNPDTSARQQDSKELSVGINVFVRPQVAGFQCVVKQRFTDFLVNEILPDGTVLHVTSEEGGKRKRDAQDELSETSLSKKTRLEPNGSDQSRDTDQTQLKPSETELSAQAEPVESKDVTQDVTISKDDETTLEAVFGETKSAAIIRLYSSIIKNPERPARTFPTVESDPISDKATRTEAHNCIRRIFQSKLHTLTVQDQSQHSGPGTVIAVKAAPPKSQSRSDERRNDGGGRGRQVWDDVGGEYLHFTLYKENKDTMEVLYFLASQLKSHVKHFTIAGTKDRRGVTVQRVAVHRVRKERMQGLNKSARGWRLCGPWEYRKQGLQLGLLQGNEFVLTLRNARFDGEQPDWQLEQRLRHAEQVVTAATAEYNKYGYLNYFGLQRFGTHSVGTHTVGLKMLQGDLEGAVGAILSYDESLVDIDPENEDKKIPRDDILRAKAIHAFRRSGTSGEAFSNLTGSRFQAEKNIITHLAKRDRNTGKRPNATDFQGALMQIQRNLRLMYVHAYQSFVWNTVAGKRWLLYGENVVEGDLVVVGEKEREEGVSQGVEAGPKVDENGEPIILPSASVAAAAGDQDTQLLSADDPFVRARPLTKAEAESGRFTIFDLVLPLPGFDVIYPHNECGKFYEEFMASDVGGGLDPHNMRRGWKDISLSGGYRKMMGRPLGAGASAEVKAYSAEDEQLVETDLERLHSTANLPNGNGVSSANGDASPKDKLAVIVKLQLGSSQYATLALRELTKGGATSYVPDYSTTHR